MLDVNDDWLSDYKDIIESADGPILDLGCGIGVIGCLLMINNQDVNNKAKIAGNLTVYYNPTSAVANSRTEKDASDKVVEYKFEKAPDPFTIEMTDEGIYNVVGPEVKKLFDATNFDRDESVRLFARKLRVMGVDAKLRELGVKNDDTVLILGYEFEFYD